MLSKAKRRTLRSELTSVPRTRVYAVLDGASVPSLPARLARAGVPHVCLYRGELAPDLAQVAPYLVQVTPATSFLDWLLEEGWGRHWGIFAVTGADMKVMRRHFRTFLLVKSPEGRQVYFRFYDPRVLRTYLPSCNEEERTALFGPILRYVTEGEREEVALRFTPTQNAARAVELKEHRKTPSC